MLTPPKPNFADALRQADTIYRDHGVPETVSQRFFNRIHTRTTRVPTRRWTTVGIGIGIASCAAALALLILRGTSGKQEATSLTVAAGFSLAQPSKNLKYVVDKGGSLAIHNGDCEAIHHEFGITVKNRGRITIKHHPGGVRLLHGTADLSVDKRSPDQAPARIWVSHGRIDVLGTKFTIRQHKDGGDVMLHEGIIRFTGDDKQSRTLEPGDTLAWPLPAIKPAPIDPVDQRRPVQKARQVERRVRKRRQSQSDPTRLSPPSEPTVDKRGSVFDEVAKLRSRRQYHEATRTLRRALTSQRLSLSARERLSYELGAILTHQIMDVTQACKHWTAHNQRYPTGRYTAEVRGTQKRLDCQDD